MTSLYLGDFVIMAAMKKSQVLKFKKRLEELRAHLTHSLKGTTAEVKKPDDATGYSQHQADQGTDDFDRTIIKEIPAHNTTSCAKLIMSWKRLTKILTVSVIFLEKISPSSSRSCSLCDHDS